MINATQQRFGEEMRQQQERVLDMMIADFVTRYAPKDDTHEAGYFHAALHSLVRAIYSEACKPYERTMTSLMAAMPIQSIFVPKDPPMTSPFEKLKGEKG